MYYLFATYGSQNGGDSSARILVGKSSKPKGDFVDKSGKKSMNNGEGEIFIDTTNSFVPQMIGPSHAGIFKNENTGEEFFSFSYYNKDEQKMSLGLFKMIWDDKGWPSIDLNQPMLDEKMNFSGALRFQNIYLVSALVLALYNLF